MTARSGLKIVHKGVVFHRYECKQDTTDYFLRCAAKIVTAAEKILANYRTVNTELTKTFQTSFFHLAIHKLHSTKWQRTCEKEKNYMNKQCGIWQGNQFSFVKLGSYWFSLFHLQKGLKRK